MITFRCAFIKNICTFGYVIAEVILSLCYEEACMEDPNTPGGRLRFFAKSCFSRITLFAVSMGYKKPGSLYDYFNGRKQPGKRLLKRFYTIGGNPGWVLSGVGPMFADNDPGKALQSRLGPFPQTTTTAPQLSEDNAESCEILFLLISLLLYRIRTAPPIARNILLIYRDMLQHALYELEKRVH